MDLTRRHMLSRIAVPAIGAGAAGALSGLNGAQAGPHQGHGHMEAADREHGGASQPKNGNHHATMDHASFRAQGSINHRRNGFDPAALVRDFDWGKTKRLASGRTLREWKLVASDKEIEVAPGVNFLAWAYNGRVPGPTLRCREGERLKIDFYNGSQHPHTIHFHGLHLPAADGVPGIGAGTVLPGQRTVYEFDAIPFGLHLYHCHVSPLAQHIAKGLYGAFIIDPKKGREEADELVMVMNGFDTNFDRTNELYAVNTIPFAYMDSPIKVKRNELVRIYLVNVLEYDLINSFHLHANFFDYYPTGTSLKASEFTDTVMQCQGQRGVVEVRFPYAGRYMFHAHQSEFAELGWQGFFEVV